MARTSSKPNSKPGSKNSKKKKELKKKELKKKPASSSRPTAPVSKQSKVSTAKVARKVAKSARIKKVVKAPSRRAASRPVKAQKKIVAKKQVKAKLQARKMAAQKSPVRAGSKARLSSKSHRSVRTAAINSRSKGKVKLPLIVSPPPPPPEPPRRQITSGALRAFEQAVRAFNRRRFEEAKEMFESVLVKFPGDFEIVARTQMYIQVCKQKLEHKVRPISPRNADELYDRGVFALNIGDFTQARAFFEKALRLHPDEPHLLYSLAATHAQTGAHEEALDYLKRSIQIQPRFRSQAYNDTDFSGLRDNRQFLELIGLTSPFDLLELKR